MFAFCHTQLQSKVMERIRNSIRKMWGVWTKINLTEKNISKKKFSDTFLLFMRNLPTVKIWGQSGKFPMSFTFLQCPLQVKKLICENSPKYVNQMGNSYCRPKLKTAISLPIFNLFQWFHFYVKDFIWIISLTEQSKFEENCQSEGIW